MSVNGGSNHQGQFSLSSSSNGGSPSVVIQQPNNNEYSFQTSPAASVTVDLPSIQHHQQASSEENGVLLCNLDDLSRYIPENYFSDFPMVEVSNSGPQVQPLHHQHAMPDYLQTVVAGKAITTTVSASQPLHLQHPVHHQPQQQPQQPQTITVHLPTQPQPIQGVKTVTYVKNSSQCGSGATTNVAAQMSPGKITQYAYTPSGERIAITGISPEATKPGSTVQVQVKGGGYQTLQLTAIEPNNSSSKVPTLVHELPGDIVTIQEAKTVRSDAISSILEEMKEDGLTSTDHMTEYATAIPVALTSDPKKTTIKRVAAPASTVFLPQNGNNATGGSKPRLIFAGHTLPQGAIPIQINGLNAIPISAVKSIPMNTTVISVSPSSTTSTTTMAAHAPSSPANNRKSNGSKKLHVSKVTNNNSSSSPGNGSFHKIQNNLASNINKAIGNNKTCNWVFENGEVCGKTFSKSYNLVVHMRMHEDVRPFGCSLCDQTFRQKAHLQRHETTHGIGVKISSRNNNNGSGSPGGMPASASSSTTRRKRKRSARSGSTNSMQQPTPTSAAMSANLQQRLARVSEQFGKSDGGSVDGGDEDDKEPQPKLRRLSIRLDRCDDSPSPHGDPNAAFQPFIATPEEAAALNEANGGSTRNELDAAVTAAVHDAISDIHDPIM